MLAAGRVSVDGALANEVAVLIGEHVARIEHADAARLRSNLAELIVGLVIS